MLSSPADFGQERPRADVQIHKIQKACVDMSGSAKRRLFTVSAWALVLIAVYNLSGILQALSLFQGERVLINLRLWGSVMLSTLTGAMICFVVADRFRRQLTKRTTVR